MFFYVKITATKIIQSFTWPFGDIERMADHSLRVDTLVVLAPQLTKPHKVKWQFASLVCFLKTLPEAASGIDLKRENMNSILIITNLIC